MQKDSQQPTTFCNSCGRYILTTNFLLHQGRCQRMSELRSSRVSQSSNHEKPNFQQEKPRIPFDQPIRQPYSFSNMGVKENIGSFKKTSSKIDNEQKIPCPFCGYAQTLAELDSHPNQCEHREIDCNFCKTKYPRSLMEDHMHICQKNPANIQRNQRNRHRMHRHQQEFEQEDEDSMPMIFSQRNRNMYRPSPLMDIFGRGFFGGNMFEGNPFQGQNQNRGGPTYQVIRFSSNGGPNLIVRSNSANPSTFVQLIQMLARRANPNENPGLNQEELNRLNRVKYQKKNEEPDLCTVCYVEFEPNEEIIELSCKHIFHQECIFEWLKRVSTCPVCKKKLKEEQSNQNEGFGQFGGNSQGFHSNQNQGRGGNNQGGGGLFSYFGF